MTAIKVSGICVYFWLTTYYRHSHNLVLLKFTIKQLNKSLTLSCLASDRYHNEIEANFVT